MDPVVMAAATVMRLQTIVSRELAGTDTAVVTIGSLQAGTAANIIPDRTGPSFSSAFARPRHTSESASLPRSNESCAAKPQPLALRAAQRSPLGPQFPQW